MSDSEYMTMDEVLDHIMRTTGKTRRQAKAALLEKINSGELPATGINEAGKRENIPPGNWTIVGE
jgi:hypothetical protein